MLLGQSIETSNHKHVATVETPQQPSERLAIRLRAGNLLRVDVAASGGLELLFLARQALTAGADASVSINGQA
jgi:hypothetical protein